MLLYKIMSKLNIDEKVIEVLLSQLLEQNHLCIIGGSKCGKSKLAEELIKRLSKQGDRYTQKRLEKIPGVYSAIEYSLPVLDKPLFYLKNVSGMSLLQFEQLAKKGYLITTFPVLSLNLLYNRFLAFNADYRDISNFDERVWNCFPLVAENKKLSDGNVYLIELFKTTYHSDMVKKENICKFVKNKTLFEEEYSRVSGKYIINI